MLPRVLFDCIRPWQYHNTKEQLLALRKNIKTETLIASVAGTMALSCDLNSYAFHEQNIVDELTFYRATS